jgi:transcriptional regulator EpsA
MSATAKACPLEHKARLDLLDAIDSLEQVSSVADLTECMDQNVRRVFPHGGFGCGITNLDGTELNPNFKTVLHRFPPEYMEEVLRQPSGGFDSPAMVRWRVTRSPVLMDLDSQGVWEPAYLDTLRRYGLGNSASHGFVDIQDSITSYFGIIKIPEKLGDRHVYLFNRLMPHLHMALVRTMASAIKFNNARDPSQAVSITPRQKEVLHWLHLGKTNWEISKILGTSEDNVKYHVGQIFSRLNATNRAQAVAKALAMNILD